jgi:multiple sugar transport system ATP-binding protein
VDVDSVRAASDEGERATLLASDRRTLFTAEVPEGTTVRPGEKIRLALDPARLHFFDPATGISLGSGALAATA